MSGSECEEENVLSRRNDQRPLREENLYEDNKQKIDIHKFDGTLHIKDYFDWQKLVELLCGGISCFNLDKEKEGALYETGND